MLFPFLCIRFLFTKIKKKVKVIQKLVACQIVVVGRRRNMKRTEIFNILSLFPFYIQYNHIYIRLLYLRIFQHDFVYIKKIPQNSFEEGVTPKNA